jgi:uncharacterized protein (DUF58 family)
VPLPEHVRDPWKPLLLAESRALTRLDYAVNAALLLAYVSLRLGDRVGLLVFSDRVQRFVPPGRAYGHFLALSEALYDIQPASVEVDYRTALAYLGTRVSRRSLVLVLTDLAQGVSAGELTAGLMHLARRHLPLLATLRDPAVERLAHLTPHDSNTTYARAVAMTTLESRREMLARVRAAGVLTVDATADALSPEVVNRYLEVKAGGRL